MNRAGNSMISINSGYSKSSMEHLSADEQACLMFLEETIESLEAGEDGGVKNVESARQSHIMHRMSQLSTAYQSKPGELTDHDEPNRVFGKSHKPHGLLVPTPLLLANGNGKFLKNPIQLVNKPNSTSLNSNHTTSFLSAGNGFSRSPTSPQTPEPNGDSSELANLPPSFIPEPPIKTGFSSGARARESTTKGNLDSQPDQKYKHFSSETVLLPPPSDFMDKPNFPLSSHQGQKLSQFQPQPQPQLSDQLQSHLHPADMKFAPRSAFGGYNENDKPISPASPKGILPDSELENLRKNTSTKGVPEKGPAVVMRPSDQKVLEQQNFPISGPDTSFITSTEFGEPKSPPAVAPKPKKLPASIILKNHNSPGPGHSLVAPSDRMITNPQKVHMEALKKLGLLKGDEPDFGISLSPQHKVAQPTSPNTSTFVVPAFVDVSNTVEQQAVLEMHGNNDLPLLSPGNRGKDNLPILRSPSSKSFEIKPVPLDQSGTGRKSLTLERPTAQWEKSPAQSIVQPSPEQLRINQSRPASVGSWKDFAVDPDLNRGQEIGKSRKSLPLPLPAQPNPDSQKPLRSHGVSVIISPQSKNEEGRKQALRRLGLIKD